MKTKQITFLFLFLTLYQVCWTQLPPTSVYHIKDELIKQNLPDIEWIIKEGDQPLTLQELIKGNLKDAEIISLSNKNRFKIDIDISYWYKIVLKSDLSNQNEKLSVNFTGGNGAFVHTFKTVKGYYLINELLVHQSLSGLGIGKSQRDVSDIYTQSLLMFDVPKDSLLEIWINVESYVSHEIHITNELISHRSIHSGIDELRASYYYFVLGSLIAILVIGLFLFFWFREKVYTWFLILIMANVLAQFFYGYGNELTDWLLPDHPIYLSTVLSLGDMVKFFVTLWFGRVFINTPKHFPNVDKVFTSTILLFFIIGSSGILFGSFRSDLPHGLSYVMFVIVILAILILIVVLAYFIFSNNKLARFYSIGAITPFLGFILVNVPITWISAAGGVFIGLGPILALGIALVYRFKVVVEEKINAEEKNREILSNQNEILEQKVEDRTAELNNSLAHLKSTQSQLIQAEKMASLGELTAGIAHEIQNPLNFVNNFSAVNIELAEELEEEINKGDLEEARAIIKDMKSNEEKINHHGKRADAIVKGMLQHSRSSAGQKEPTDINALCDEYLRLSYHGLRAKDKNFNSDIVTEFDTDLPKVNIIPQDIGRVLLNLINNAFYAVNERSQKESEGYQPMVKISTLKIPSSQEGAGGVVITVSDNGNGIPDPIKDKIFQPFFTTKPTGQGTGLGLSLSYDIVKAHGGELKVETKEGEGSTFIIQLPVV